MHGLQEKGYGSEVEMHMVLFKCLWFLHEGLDVDARERFEKGYGTNREINWGLGFSRRYG